MKDVFLIPALLLLLTMVGGQAYCQTEAKVLSLEDAISLGLKNNSYLKIADTRVDLAAARLQQVKDGRLPQAGASMQYARLYLLSPFSLSEEMTLPANHFDAMIGAVSVSKEIFDGFLDKAKHETNVALVQASKMDAAKDREDIRYNITSLYYNIYKISKSEDIINENLRLLDEREREASNMLKEGILLSNDLLKIQLQKSNLQVTKVDIKDAMEVSLYNLSILTGMPDDQPLEIDTNLFLGEHVLSTVEDLAGIGLLSRNEIKAAEYRVTAAEGGLKQLKSAYLPHVDVSAMYLYLNPMVPQHFIPQKGGFLQALNLGLSVKYNIGSLYGLKGKKQEATLNIVQAENAIAVQRDQIKLEVFKQYKAYQSSVEKIAVSEVAYKQANKSFQLSSSQFRNGLLLSGDLMQSQNLLLQSQLNVLQAKIDAQLAYYRLEKAIGGSIK